MASHHPVPDLENPLIEKARDTSKQNLFETKGLSNLWNMELMELMESMELMELM